MGMWAPVGQHPQPYSIICQSLGTTQVPSPAGMSKFNIWRSGQSGRLAEQLVWLLFWHLSWCCAGAERLQSGFRLLSVMVAHV